MSADRPRHVHALPSQSRDFRHRRLSQRANFCARVGGCDQASAALRTVRRRSVPILTQIREVSDVDPEGCRVVCFRQKCHARACRRARRAVGRRRFLFLWGQGRWLARAARGGAAVSCAHPSLGHFPLSHRASNFRARWPQRPSLVRFNTATSGALACGLRFPKGLGIGLHANVAVFCRCS